MKPEDLIDAYFAETAALEDECDALLAQLRARHQRLRKKAETLADHFAPRQLFSLSTGEIVAIPTEEGFACGHVRERRPDGRPYTRNTIYCGEFTAGSLREIAGWPNDYLSDHLDDDLLDDNDPGVTYMPPRPWEPLGLSDTAEHQLLQQRCARHFDPTRPREIPPDWTVIYTRE